MDHPPATIAAPLDLPLAALLVVIAVVWLILAIVHHLRAERAREWESHVTTAPGLGTPAPDSHAWADEKRGWA